MTTTVSRNNVVFYIGDEEERSYLNFSNIDNIDNTDIHINKYIFPQQNNVILDIPEENNITSSNNFHIATGSFVVDYGNYIVDYILEVLNTMF